MSKAVLLDPCRAKMRKANDTNEIIARLLRQPPERWLERPYCGWLEWETTMDFKYADTHGRDGVIVHILPLLILGAELPMCMQGRPGRVRPLLPFEMKRRSAHGKILFYALADIHCKFSYIYDPFLVNNKF